jgi:hypothetical protein
MRQNQPLSVHEMARFLHGFSPKSRRRKRAGTAIPRRRWDDVMDRDNGYFGLVVGGIVALAAMIFIFSGGELGGKKTVEGDQDLPPVATADQN